MDLTVYTIGHSNHSIEQFLSLVKTAGIAVVADVRSSPYSRFQNQFNRESLKEVLRREGVKYLFLGDKLGARPSDRSCYRDGIAEYALIRETPQFQEGIDRIIQGAENFRIVLMCAEKEPLDCHRTILVSRALHSRGVGIWHILADGQLELHTETERRLLKLTKQENSDLFSPDPLLLAYTIRGRQISFKEEQTGQAE